MLSSVIVSARNALYGDKIKFLTKSEIELMIAKTNRADIQPYELLKFLNTYVTQAKAKSKYETFLSKTIEDVLSCISRNLDEITKNYPDERNDIAMLLTKLKSLCPASLFQPQSSGASINRLGTVGSTNREDNQYFPPSKVHKANLNTGFSSACTYNRPLLLLSSLLPIKESVEDKLTIPNSSENPIVAKIPENTDLTAKTNSDGRIITNHILLTREMGAKTSFRSAHLDEIKITGKVEEKTFTNNSSLVLHHIYYELDLASVTFNDLTLTSMCLVNANFNKLQGENCDLIGLIIEDSIMSNMRINTSLWNNVRLFNTQFENTWLDKAEIIEFSAYNVKMNKLVIKNSSFLRNSSINSSLMNGAMFENVIFEQVNISDTKLIKAKILGEKITDLDYTSKFTQCILKNVVSRSSCWRYANFTNVYMNNLDFVSSSLQNVTFKINYDFADGNTYLSHVNFSSCRMSHIYFSGFHMYYFNFSFSKLDHIFVGNNHNLSEISFKRNITIRKSSFESSTIRESYFFDVKFLKCNFFNALIYRLYLSNSVFSSCNLDGLIIEDGQDTQTVIFTNYKYTGNGFYGSASELIKEDFTNTEFNPGYQNIIFRNCNLNQSLFYQIGLAGLIDNCYLIGVKIIDCKWLDLEISNCIIGKLATFQNVQFRCAIFNNNDMINVRIKEAEFINVQWEKLTILNSLFEGLISFRNGVIINNTTIINGDFQLAKLVMSNSSVKKLTFLYDESRRAEDDQALPNFGGQISCSNMNEVYLEFRNLEVNGDIIIDNSPTNLIFSGTTKITGQIIIKNSANISIALLDQVELAASVKYEYSEVVEYISRGVDMSELKLTNLESKVQTILLD